MKVLNTYQIEHLTLEKIEKIIIPIIQTYSDDWIGSKVFITGVNRIGNVTIHIIDSLEMKLNSYQPLIFEPQSSEEYVFEGAYPKNEDKQVYESIIQKNIYSTRPWESCNKLIEYMGKCIYEIFKKL